MEDLVLQRFAPYDHRRNQDRANQLTLSAAPLDIG
jgi:hypothetical protein